MNSEILRLALAAYATERLGGSLTRTGMVTVMAAIDAELDRIGQEPYQEVVGCAPSRKWALLPQHPRQRLAILPATLA